MAVVYAMPKETLGEESLEVLELGNCLANFRSLRDLVEVAKFSNSGKFNPGFRDDPRFGDLAGLSFMDKTAGGAIRLLAWPNLEQVAEDTYSAQQDKIDSSVRTVSCVEIVQFALRYFEEYGNYPDLGWTWLLTDDLVEPEEWPPWYRQFRQIGSNLRVAVRFDSVNGIIVSLMSADGLVANGAIAVTW